jgi:hypothetical protein
MQAISNAERKYHFAPEVQDRVHDNETSTESSGRTRDIQVKALNH